MVKFDDFANFWFNKYALDQNELHRSPQFLYFHIHTKIWHLNTNDDFLMFFVTANIIEIKVLPEKAKM